MAVGDVVAGIGGVGVALSFQPAAGVECMISAVAAYQNWYKIDNGVTSCLLNNVTAGENGVNKNMKLFINNATYLYVGAYGGQANAYSGIQIK